MKRQNGSSLQLLYILALVLPWLIFLLRPRGTTFGLLLFWFAMAFSWLLIWNLATCSARGVERPDTGPRMLNEIEQPDVVRQVMDVKIAMEERRIQTFRGPLRKAADVAYEKLSRAFSGRAVPLIQEDEKLGANILLVPKATEGAEAETPVRPWLHWLLFSLTVITTTWAGAAHQGIDLVREPARFGAGLP
jgi:hypothetical protein